jgi:hypothetical protein
MSPGQGQGARVLLLHAIAWAPTPSLQIFEIKVEHDFSPE